MVQVRHLGLGFAVVVAVSLVVVGLVTPSVALPVGMATATGPSMGTAQMQFLVYADLPVEVGDRLVYRFRDEYVHHRVVGRTPAGFQTRGDAATRTD